jgi:tetratricopeptide (TPR) repeat protein
MVMDMCKRNQEALSERWEPLLNNLGHCCRKNKKLQESLNFHTRALSLKPLNPQTYTAIGFVQALMGRLSDAVESFHKSLSLKRDDVITSTILKSVLEDLCDEMIEDGVKSPPVSIILGDSMNTTSSIIQIELGSEAKETTETFRKLKFDDADDDSQDMSLDI